jgi:alkanesulfonate monooxygenase SsuD/methylene tetrahydromethanopterin reductase-like flavin-dependent oxidoreductase (luciferase family)
VGPATAGARAAAAPAPAPVRLPLAATRPASIPVYLAAGGPANLRLCGRVADGWIGMFSSPQQTARSIRAIGDGAASVGRPLTGFDHLVCVPAFVDDDPRRAADRLRAHYAHLLTIGGPERNIYARLARLMGHADTVDAMFGHVAAGDRAAAARAVPYGFIDATALIGPAARIADRLAEYRRAGATTVSLMVSSADADTAERIKVLTDVAEAWRQHG